MGRATRNVILASTIVLAMAGARALAQQQKKDAAPKQSPSALFQRAKPAADTAKDLAYPARQDSTETFFKAKPKNAEELDRYINNSTGFLFVEIGFTGCPPTLAMEHDVSGVLSQLAAKTGKETEFLKLDMNASDFRKKAETVVVEKACEIPVSNIAAGLFMYSQPAINANGRPSRKFSSSYLVDAIEKLSALKEQGGRVKITLDGTRQFVAVLEGDSIGIYTAATYIQSGTAPGILAPLYMFVYEGKIVMGGVTYDPEADKEMLQAKIIAIARELAPPPDTAREASPAKKD